MSNDVNKYGLKRSDLTAEIKRQVRQRCGYGCVICGGGICDYEHVDPTFAEAHEHDPNCMALLCTGCHGKVTRGMLSKDTVKAASKNPKALEKGFAAEFFDVGTSHPIVNIGVLSAVDCKYILTVNSEPVLWITQSEKSPESFCINADFRNNNGITVLKIVDNEWRVRTGNWDAEVIGNRLTIRNGPRDIALRMRSDPPTGISIELMRMQVEGVFFEFLANQMEITLPNGQTISALSMHYEGCQSVITIDRGSAGFGRGGLSVFKNVTVN